MSEISLPINDHVLLFFVLIFIILVSPILSRQIKLPGIVGIILAGVIVGPNGLNIIAMSSAIELLGAVGLLYIMFLAGLDINLTDFKRNKDKSLIFGILTFVIPQLFGTFLFRLLGFSWPAAILIASMFASHTLVGYPIITKLGIVRNRAVLTTVGGTIFADTLALLVLAIVARSANGGLDLNFWITLIILSTIYVLAMVYLLPILGRLFFRHADDGIIQFLFVLAVAFLCAFLARAIGIEPIVGAFLAGLVLNRMVPASSQLMNRVQFVGNSLFIPFFLLYIGMIVDVEVLLRSPASWLIMATMLATNMLTKLVSSKLTQRIFKFTKEEGWVIFGLTTTEAAATLAATLVGYRLGIIGDEILNGVVLMILVTCIIGPWVVEHYGRKIAFEKAGEKFERVSFPHVLVPLSNPSTVNHLLSVAIILKDYALNHISALSVLTDPMNLDDHQDFSEKLLNNAREYAVSAGIELNTLKRIDVNVANAISRAALEEHANLLIIGWNGQISAQDRIFGSVLDQLLELSSQSIFVCKMENSIMSNSRIVLYLPPKSIKEPGFFDVITSVVHLAMGMNAPLHLALDEGLLDVMELTLKGMKTKAEINFHTFSAVEPPLEQLASVVKKDDLLIAVGARRKTMSWLPYADQLPNKLAAGYRDMNFIIAYPGIPYEKHEFITFERDELFRQSAFSFD
ncbi:cation:proton antiporter [Gaoshiqia sp. Z1-71]|uniref:cation:proton antiporter domain-containing protein n=1 Tax=Gaoshiqia hydrogeniformans TaxID=3290090 RepID=UPI003BF7AEDF